MSPGGLQEGSEWGLCFQRATVGTALGAGIGEGWRAGWFQGVRGRAELTGEALSGSPGHRGLPEREEAASNMLSASPARLLPLAGVLHGPHPAQHDGEPGPSERLRRGHVSGTAPVRAPHARPVRGAGEARVEWEARPGLPVRQALRLPNRRTPRRPGGLTSARRGGPAPASLLWS